MSRTIAYCPHCQREGLLPPIKMKVTPGVFSAEGFVSGLAIQFENGLLLRTGESLLWCGQKRAAEITQQFEAVLDVLAEAGFEVDRESFDENKP